MRAQELSLQCIEWHQHVRQSGCGPLCRTVAMFACSEAHGKADVTQDTWLSINQQLVHIVVG